MTKFDRTFQPMPFPIPFKVSQCAAAITRLFMSPYSVMLEQVDAPHRSFVMRVPGKVGQSLRVLIGKLVETFDVCLKTN